jgi:hypothetical protein
MASTKPKVIYVEGPLNGGAPVVDQPGKTRHTNDRDVQRKQTVSSNQKRTPLCVVRVPSP